MAAYLGEVTWDGELMTISFMAIFKWVNFRFFLPCGGGVGFYLKPSLISLKLASVYKRL